MFFPEKLDRLISQDSRTASVIADSVGIRASYLSQLRSGKREKPRWDVVEKLAKTLRVEPDAFTEKKSPVNNKYSPEKKKEPFSEVVREVPSQVKAEPMGNLFRLVIEALPSNKIMETLSAFMAEAGKEGRTLSKTELEAIQWAIDSLRARQSN